MSLFGLDRCEVVAVLEWAAVVEPVDPFGRGDLEVVQSLPRSPRFDEVYMLMTAVLGYDSERVRTWLSDALVRS